MQLSTRKIFHKKKYTVNEILLKIKKNVRQFTYGIHSNMQKFALLTT